MKLAVKRALVTLGILVLFGMGIALLVATGHPLWKEFVGAIAGGVTGVIATVYAAQAKDHAKEAQRQVEAAKRD